MSRQTCGMRNDLVRGRVENGQVAVPHSWPWVGHVEVNSTFYKRLDGLFRSCD